MIKTGLWHDAAINELIALLRSDEFVRALILTGSCVQPQGKDTWSDIDVVVVVDNAALDRFYPSTDWLASPSELFAIDQSSHPNWLTTRVCFTDMRRIDFSFIKESTLQQVAEWDYNPFWAGPRILFSRSPIKAALEHTPERPKPPVFTTDQFQTMANHFWFKGMLSVNKVMRNDLLIGLHLALDMVRDCLVLGMLLRDRAEGTNHHRFGGMFNHVVDQLNVFQHRYTPTGILGIVEQSSIAFDELAAQWSDSYQEHRQPLIDWIAYARDTLAQSARSK